MIRASALSTLVLLSALVPSSPAEAQLVSTSTPASTPARTGPRSGADLFGDEDLPLTEPKLTDPGLQWLVQWNMAMPAFETFDFSGRYSFRGISLAARYRLEPELSVGLSSAWQVFDIKETSTEKVENITITGTQVRHTNSVPILAEAHYYLPFTMGDRSLEAFGGLGFGPYYVERRLELGALISRDDKTWHVGFAPEIGVLIPLRWTCFVASVRWHLVLEAEDVPWQSYFNFNLGFVMF